MPTPTTLRMSGGMPSKPNLHMVQCMCSHTWPSISGGGTCQIRTTSSYSSTLWYSPTTTTPGMYQDNCIKLHLCISTHIYLPLLGPSTTPERVEHQSYAIKNQNNTLKFLKMSQNVFPINSLSK